jgi:hypothetical protein
MTPERFRDLLIAVDLRDYHAIKLLNADDRRFRRWKSGERPIPKEVEAWLEALAAHWAANPPPDLRGLPREDSRAIPLEETRRETRQETRQETREQTRRDPLADLFADFHDKA